MHRHALAEKRPYLMFSIAAAMAYYLLRDGALGGIYLAAIKGAAVALLAAYAWHHGHGHDSRMIAGVMALGALGDAAIEFWVDAGGLLFFAGHVLALALYLQPRNRRTRHSPSQKAAAVALLLLTPIAAFFLAGELAIGLYGLALGGMAAAAWMSRFSRHHVGIGALLLVASDLLFFVELGGAGAQESWGSLSRWLAWPAYYAGQFLICTGVVHGSRPDRPA